MHSTKKAELFVRGFGSLAEKWPEPTLMSIEELQGTSFKSQVSACGELIPLHREMLAGKIESAPLQSLADTLPTFLAELSYDKKLLLPWYGRGW